MPEAGRHKWTDDESMMRRALELAALGEGRVSPSPLVGCVVVSSEGDIVGEGSYVFREVTHAEVIALQIAGEKARNGTAYVSLEPHAHHGRTPPCTDALIEAGIARVVCPIEDPNPLVSGKGFETLRGHGIEVDVGLLSDEASRQNEKFICWHRNKRPFVHIKCAASLDGKIATITGESKWITSDESRQAGQRLRHEYDAILVGSGTAQADDPALTDRTGLPRSRPLVRVVLDSSLAISLDSNLVTTAREEPLIVFAAGGEPKRAEALRQQGVEVVEIEGGPGDLSTVMDELYARQVTSVLVEGGAGVAGSFLVSGMADKFTFFLAPMLIGGGDAPVAIGGTGFKNLGDVVRLTDLKIQSCGPDLMIEAYPVER